MDLRRDALAAAAEMMLAIEARARKPSPNSSPPSGGSTSSRARSTSSRAWRASRSTCARRATSGAAAPSPTSPRRCRRSRTGAQRRSRCSRRPTRRPAYVCDPRIVAGFEAAVVARRRRAVPLPSGAGHDTMVMGQTLAGRHAVRALQGRRQPQSRGVDHSGGLRARARGADALRQGFSRLGDGALSRE